MFSIVVYVYMTACQPAGPYVLLILILPTANEYLFNRVVFHLNYLLGFLGKPHKGRG